MKKQIEFVNARKDSDWDMEERKLEESIDKNFKALLSDIYKLSPSKKFKILVSMQSTLAAFKKATTSHLTIFSPLPEPTGNYERYKPRTDALEHLQRVWGRFLTYFGAKEDLLFQQDLRRLDEKLMIALENQVGYKNRIGKMEAKVCDVIKPLKEKIAKELEEVFTEEDKKDTRIYQVARKRYHHYDV